MEPHGHGAYRPTVDAIVRVSKQGSREYLRSDQQQLDDIKRELARRGWRLGKVFREIDVSGKTTKRKALLEARERIDKGKSQGIVVAYVSRFSRNTVEGLELVKWVLDQGAEFVALDLPFDLRTAEGEKYLTDKLSEARYVWRQAQDQFARGVREAVARKVNISVPYGYQRSAGRGTPLAAHPVEARVVLDIYKRRGKGQSWSVIARALNKAGKLPRPYKRDKLVQQGQWLGHSVAKLVGSEVYLGVARCGAARMEGAHPALVTPRQWAKANGTKGTSWARPSEGYALSGLVRCGGCGYAMCHSSEGYYRCRSAQVAAQACAAPASLNAAKAHEEARLRYLRHVGRWQAEPAADDHALAAALAEEEAALGRADAATDAVAKPGLSPRQEERLRRHAAEEEARYEQAAAKVREERQRATAGLFLEGHVDEDGWEGMSPSEHRRLLAGAYAAVVVQRSEAWSTEVASRMSFVGRHEAPSTRQGLIAYSRGLAA